MKGRKYTLGVHKSDKCVGVMNLLYMHNTHVEEHFRGVCVCAREHVWPYGVNV